MSGKKLFKTVLFGFSLAVFSLWTTSVFAYASYSSHSASSSSSQHFYADIDFFPVIVHTNDTTGIDNTGAPTVATLDGLGLDFHGTIGYTIMGEWLVGFSYNYYNLTQDRPNVPGGNSGVHDVISKSEYGPSIGYVGSNWHAVFTYFLNGTRQEDTRNFDETGTIGNVTFVNSSMTGFQISVAYTFHVSENFELGPAILYRNVSYPVQSKTNRLNSIEDYSNVKMNSAYVEGAVTPMVSMTARF